MSHAEVRRRLSAFESRAAIAAVAATGVPTNDLIDLTKRKSIVELEQMRVREANATNRDRWLSNLEARARLATQQQQQQPQSRNTIRATNALLDLQPSRRIVANSTIHILDSASSSSTTSTSATTTIPPAAIMRPLVIAARNSNTNKRRREQRVPAVPRSSWNRPDVMLETYAFLYNTIDTLAIEMDETLWRKVYALPPMRNRRLNWSRLEEARSIQFLPQYQTPIAGLSGGGGDEYVFPVSDLDPRQFDEGRATVARVGAKRRQIEGAASRVELPFYARSNGLFDPPVTIRDRMLRRSYVQQNDGFLCATHALNNVANRIMFAPADMLGVIDVFRPLGNMFAQLEEVILTALREGIFMLQVSLTSLTEFNPLHEAERHPARKTFLRFLKQAGGMLVYRPSAAGHFVSLVYSDDPSLPPATPRWAIWDGKNVSVRATTAASALSTYIFKSDIVGISDPEVIRRERARHEQNLQNVIGSSYFGLLPISLEVLLGIGVPPSLRDSTNANDNDDDDNDESGDDSRAAAKAEYLETLTLTRSLLRRFLSETTVIETGLHAENPINEQREEISSPIPMSANNFESIARDMSGYGLTGREPTNPVSFMSARFVLDQTLNKHFDGVAEILLQVHSKTPLSRFWRREMTNHIKQAASLLVDSTGVGMFFSSAGLYTDEERETMFKIHTHRRWFRYFVLYIACTVIDNYIGTKPEIPKPPGVSERDNPRNNPDNDRWYVEPIPAYILRILMVLCMVGFTNHVTSGEPLTNTPHIVKLISFMFHSRHGVLIREKLPPWLSTIIATADLVIEGEEARDHADRLSQAQERFTEYLAKTRYDKSLWLLELVAAARLPNFPLPSVEPFRLTRAARQRSAAIQLVNDPEFDVEEFLSRTWDNGSPEMDRTAEFCAILRSTLFRLPLARQNFQSVAEALVELRTDDATPLVVANFMHESASLFIAEVLKPELDYSNDADNDEGEPMVRLHVETIDSEDVAREWIDIVAFDRRFASSVWVQASNDYTTHRITVAKPRLFERALQRGFDLIHRRVFALHMTAPDARPPIHSNPTRIPQTNARSEVTRSWTEVRPSRLPQAELSVAPLGSPMQ